MIRTFRLAASRPESAADQGFAATVREIKSPEVSRISLSPYWATAPMLADLNDDTILDIVSADWGSNLDAISTTVRAYNYNNGSPTLLWTRELTPPIAFPIGTGAFENGLLGSHAIADIDADGRPEILISHYGWLSALNHDGTILWQTELDPGFPGGISVADLDGDTEPEIITGMRYEFEPGRFGKLYAVDGDGTVLWDVIAEDSTSANNASVLDLNGDGVFEVAWNGKQQGFTIFNGADGSILFNEPLAYTISGSDYPIIVDVDGDDFAEIVVPTLRGPVVFGMDGVWGEARSIWNQQTYHITNINDDLSVPISEFNSWEVHNTYHTQYPSEIALPVFRVNISHTVGTQDVTVDNGSFNVPPDISANPNFQWDYVQTIVAPIISRTFDSRLDNLTIGETRLVAAGTAVSYTLNSGQNFLTLPPLYVEVGHIITIDPFSQTVGAGATATFSVTLINHSAVPDNYTLALVGELAAWDNGLPPNVTVPANGQVIVPMTITVPAEAAGDFTFSVTAVNGSGGSDEAVGQLIVVDALDLTLSPTVQLAGPGESVTYTLTISNLLPAAQTMQLSADGLPDVTVPPTLLVAGNGTATVPVAAKGYVAGGLAFGITAVNESGATDEAAGVLDVSASQQLLLDLNPDPAIGGPGMATVVSVTVTNIGDALAQVDLTVDVPAGWEAQLTKTAVTLPPVVFNSATVRLILIPPLGAVPGPVAYTVDAVANAGPLAPAQPAQATADGIVQVAAGVDVAITPAARTLLPSDSAAWDVTVTNTGAAADTFDLSVTGIVALSGQFSAGSVTLNPGQSTTVQLTANNFTFALPQTYKFGVAAQSQTNANVADEAEGTITFNPQEAVHVLWSPDVINSAIDQNVHYLVTVTNTGNVATEYAFNLSAPGVTLNQTLNRFLLPAHTKVTILVSARSAAAGTYMLTASALSPAGTNDSDQAALIVDQAVAITLLDATTLPSPPFADLPTGWLLLTAVLLLVTLLNRRRQRALSPAARSRPLRATPPARE